MLLRSIPFTLLFALSITAFSQGRQCATHEYNEMLEREYPEVALARQQIEEFTAMYTQGAMRLDDTGVVTIPVVVHILYHPNIIAQNLSYARVAEQIEVLNEDFGALNADTVNIPALFKPDHADTRIQFCLASRDPQGNWTDGITRTATTYTSFSMNDNAVIKSTAQGGHDPWPRDDYLNIWVCNLSGNILGYSQLPGGPASTDGVVIAYKYFGKSGASFPYNEGRTTTHELGHFFNLFHIWGDDNGACWGTDYCDDTPNQASDNYGCPTFPHPSCSNTSDMFMNYMDYVDDDCMNMFTHDQADRMWAALNGPRAGLKSSIGCTPHVGLPEVLAVSELRVFPVPAASELDVSYSLPLPARSGISLYNELGELVMVREVAVSSSVRERFDLGALPEGLYLLRIDTPGSTLTRKVMHVH